MSEAGPIIAIDLGGTRFRVGLVDASGKILGRISEATRSEEGPARLVERIESAAWGLLKKGGFREPVGVGAAVAGPLDSEGVMHDPPNLVGWGTVPIKAMLRERLRAPVSVGNDANVACLGEHRFGSARGVDDVIYVTVSTGVGGGVITGGELVTGWKGLGAEVGHIIVDPNAPRGHCGHVGCLESLVSGTAIAARARDALRAGAESSLRDAVKGNVGRVGAKHVFQAAAAGDEFGLGMIRQVSRDLAHGIVSLVHIFNPRMFILGGGVTRDWHMLAPEVHRVVSQQTFPEFLDGFDIMVSAFGDDVGLVGAAALVLRDSGVARG